MKYSEFGKLVKVKNYKLASCYHIFGKTFSAPAHRTH